MANVNFTNEELLFLHRVMKHADKNKGASRSANIIAQVGYEEIPKEMEQVRKKISDALSQK